MVVKMPGVVLVVDHCTGNRDHEQAIQACDKAEGLRPARHDVVTLCRARLSGLARMVRARRMSGHGFVLFDELLVGSLHGRR